MPVLCGSSACLLDLLPGIAPQTPYDGFSFHSDIGNIESLSPPFINEIERRRSMIVPT